MNGLEPVIKYEFLFDHTEFTPGFTYNDPFLSPQNCLHLDENYLLYTQRTLPLNGDSRFEMKIKIRSMQTGELIQTITFHGAHSFPHFDYFEGLIVCTQSNDYEATK